MDQGTGNLTVLPYEQRLRNDLRWAMDQGDLFFQGKGGAHDAMRKIARRLDELGIPYVVAGGMALFAHGFHRYTEVVDILVTGEGLKRIHQELAGRGYLPPFGKSKNLRDTELGVKIEFLVTGQYPGDGQPKPVAFPDPKQVAAEGQAGIKYVNLPTFVELKLASGMTGKNREKDLLDVRELINVLNLAESFSQKLHPYVREKYLELCCALPQVAKTYVKVRPMKSRTAEPKSIGDLIALFPESAAELEAMRADGVEVDADGATENYIDLFTTSPEVAKKYGMDEKTP